MSTPLIVTNVGDMGSLVRRFRLGKVVPSGDVRKLAGAMKEFIEKRRDYSEKAPEALELLSIEKAADDYLRIIRPPSTVRRPPPEIIIKNG
jgi:glycosyltransferase involved in cell wall biosynthesis